MKMHYCTCTINLAGQGFYLHNILATEPMSWPEVQVMMAVHRDENVFDIKPIAVREITALQEKQRLMAKYNQKQGLIEQLFPGRNPTSMELLVPGQPDDQPLADDFGIPLKPFIHEGDGDDDGRRIADRDPPTGQAVFKPRRPFNPQPPAVQEPI